MNEHPIVNFRKSSKARGHYSLSLRRLTKSDVVRLYEALSSTRADSMIVQDIKADILSQGDFEHLLWEKKNKAVEPKPAVDMRDYLYETLYSENVGAVKPGQLADAIELVSAYDLSLSLEDAEKMVCAILAFHRVHSDDDINISTGVYYITWKDGSGVSVASVYIDSQGVRWIAPASWTGPAKLIEVAAFIKNAEPII